MRGQSRAVVRRGAAMAIFNAGDRFSLGRQWKDRQGKSQFGGQWKIAVRAINGGRRGREGFRNGIFVFAEHS